MPVADYNLAIEICNVASITSIGLQTDFQIVLESFLGDDPQMCCLMPLKPYPPDGQSI